MSTKKSKKSAAKSSKKASKPEASAKRARTASAEKTKRVSALDAAATVLRKSGNPMRCTDMITAMAEQGLWTSPGGKTPHATLYSAILREIGAKGKAARFRKTDRGQFEFTGAEA